MSVSAYQNFEIFYKVKKMRVEKFADSKLSVDVKEGFKDSYTPLNLVHCTILPM